MESKKDASELKVTDMAPRCCEAWEVGVRADRPCLYLEHLLSAEECEELLAKYGVLHDSAPASLESGSRSEFKREDEEWSKKLFERIQPFIPTELDGGVSVGLRREWHHARYFPGQSVFAHMDQRQTSAEHRTESSVASRITLNIYLDENYTGGEFVFVRGVRLDGTWEVSHTQLTPKAGAAVLFYQGIPEFSHAVPKLISGSKTIMRSDVLYRFNSPEEADVGGKNVIGGAPTNA